MAWNNAAQGGAQGEMDLEIKGEEVQDEPRDDLLDMIGRGKARGYVRLCAALNTSLHGSSSGRNADLWIPPQLFG